MRNMLEVLMSARKKKIFDSQDEFISILEKIKEFDSQLSVDWDKGIEEWCRIFHKQLGMIAMINVRIAVIFIRQNYDYSMLSIILDSLGFEVQVTEDFDKDEWYIDLNRLKNDIDEIDWHISKDAINSEEFCLNDFYVATV